MANKLKDVFSNSQDSYESTLRFKDNDAYRNFRVALDAVEKGGNTMIVDGIESISLFLQDHGVRFPIEKIEGVSQLVIGPSKEPFDFALSWDEKEKIFHFDKYRVDSGIVLETKKDEVVYLKLVFSEDGQKVRITYNIQYQHAKSVEDIAFELQACLCFLSKFYTPTEIMGSPNEAARIKEILGILEYAKGFISRLFSVEQALGLSFDPKLLQELSAEDQIDIEELYLLLCKKIPLRMNAKLNSTDTTSLVVSEVQKDPVIGTQIALVFNRSEEHILLEQPFTIYTANALINAVIKDFKQDGNDTTVYFGDTDSQPMYIAYSAFLNEEDAQRETSKAICGEDRYVNAHTVVEHLKMQLENSNNSLTTS